MKRAVGWTLVTESGTSVPKLEHRAFSTRLPKVLEALWARFSHGRLWNCGTGISSKYPREADFRLNQSAPLSAQHVDLE